MVGCRCTLAGVIRWDGRRESERKEGREGGADRCLGLFCDFFEKKVGKNLPFKKMCLPLQPLSHPSVGLAESRDASLAQLARARDL